MPRVTTLRCPYCGTDVRKTAYKKQHCPECGRVVRDERESLSEPTYIQ